MQRTGNQLEETLQLEKMTQMRMLQEGRMLEETLQQNQLQQSHQQGQLQDQSQQIHSQQVVDVKNQQLEAQIARIQQEKAESDSKLSQQNERMKGLEDLVKSHRTKELSPTIVNTPWRHVDTKGPAGLTVERQTSPELRNSAGVGKPYAVR